MVRSIACRLIAFCSLSRLVAVGGYLETSENSESFKMCRQRREDLVIAALIEI